MTEPAGRTYHDCEVIMSIRFATLLLSGIVLFVAGCGGGGSSTTSVPTLPHSPGAPAPVIPSGSLVVAQASGTVSIYPPDATTPLRSFTIAGGLGRGLAIAPNGDIVVNSGGSDERGFSVYRGDASGVATPLRTVLGSNTGIQYPVTSVAIDPAGNIWAAWGRPDGYAISIFTTGASGNVAPARTFAPFVVTDIAFAANGDLVAAGFNFAARRRIIENFSPAGTAGLGAFFPLASDGSLFIGGCLALTATGYVTCGNSADGSSPTIRSLVPVPGDFVVTRTLSGPATTMVSAGSMPHAAAVDQSGSIYAGTDDGRVLVFAAAADGNVAPTRILSLTSAVVGLAIAP